MRSTAGEEEAREELALKQERSDKRKKTEQGDCLIINIGSRDMSRNIPDIPRRVNIGTECISLTRVKLKGNGGLCLAQTHSEAISAAAFPKYPLDN